MAPDRTPDSSTTRKLTPFLKEQVQDGSGNSGKKKSAKSFTFRELAEATRNFSAVNLIGEGGFGKTCLPGKSHLDGTRE
ncbi:Serine/threonine-protein kinase [Acorus calamus]|uniref:Serine/threonine-protein kinase n=1 Tax=Acorus calamus TaxID=4465 RepID=A0AAV9DA49_ACOCL|nr:Serine/threonine-protein kinase [Acorus calamus]